MNSSPSPDPVDSASLSRAALTSGGSTIFNTSVQRYSRSTLFLLRNEARSRRRPECHLRTELMSLGVWKINNVSSSYPQNGNEAGGSVIGNNNSNNQGTVTHINTRGQRSPSTRNSLGVIEHASSCHYGSHSNQKSYIDHRTISSAHLMPAFAKRRIGVPSQVSSSFGGGGGSASTGIPETPCDGSHPGKELPLTSRQRGKEHLHDRQRGEEHTTANFLSPQRKNLGDFDRDRSEGNHSGSASPASSALPHSRHNLTSSGNERRIGSGRLLHCDVNWDFRSADKDSVRNANSSDKDSSSHHQQQRSSSRYTERGAERSNYADRRSFDRRNNDIDSRDRFENRSTNLHSGSSRRFVTHDNESNLNSAPSTEQHTGQLTRTRRNHYKDRNDEPEWFSGGPTSQHDTIELRGFDEIDELGTNKHSKHSHKSKEIEEKEFESNSNSAEALNEDSVTGTTTPLLDVETPIGILNRSDKNNNDGQQQLKLEIDSKPVEQQQEDGKLIFKKINSSINSGITEFNFDAFLNVDPLKHSFMGPDIKADEDLGMIGNSRFSRWFENKNYRPDTRNHTHVNQSLDGRNSNDTRDIKRADADGLRSPILNETQNIKQTNTLMQFLQRSRLPSAISDGTQPHVGIPSVEELEARMKKIGSVDMASEAAFAESNEKNILNKSNERDIAKIPEQTSAPKVVSVPTTPQDTEAFKKLLEQLGSANKPEDLQLNSSLQHQPDHQILQNPASTLNVIANNPLSSHMPKTEEINKFIQQQQYIHQQQRQMQQCHPVPFQQLHSEPLQVLQPHMQSILSGQKRIEAQNLLHCISRGEVKIAFLEQEINNPNISPYTRDIFAAVLTEHCRSVTPSNSMLNIPHSVAVAQVHKLHSPTPVVPGSQLSIQQQSLQNHTIIMGSPQMPNTVILPLQQQPIPQQPMPSSAGLPSPRELHFHTQTIMQNAIMKKKLEEQEIFRRRQEMQKQALPNAMMASVHPLDMEMSQKSIHQHQLQASSVLPIQQQSPQTLQISPQQAHQTHPSQSIQQQQRHINSPTPLAFTPTSVLRKMTAEKDSTAAANAQQQQAGIQIQSTSMSNQRQQHHQLSNKNMQSIMLNQQQQIMQQSHQQTQVLNPNISSQPQTQQQPRMILGGGNHPQQQVQLIGGGQPITQQQHALQQQQNPVGVHPSQQPQKLRTNQQLKWSGPPMLNQQQIPVNKPIGRPILKGPLLPAPPQQKQQQMPPMTFASKIEYQQIQQQQKLKINPPIQHMQQQQFTISQQQPTQTNIMNHVQQHLFQQQQQQQHQQRAVALQRAQHIQLQQLHQQQPPQQLHQQQPTQQLHQQQPPQPQQQPPQQPQQQLQQPSQQPPQQPPQQQPQLQPQQSTQQLPQQQPSQQLNRPAGGIIVSNQPQPVSANAAAGNSGGIMNYQRDGGLSPTSNQLAQWFSPELLAQASAGKLPLLNMNQALSLEEFERSIQHSSAAVHN